MTKPYVLGIDIGGTNSVFGIVDARGQVVASDSIKTQKHNNFDDYVDELHAAVMRLLKYNDAEDKIHGIGIGAPNANYYTGELVNAVNLPWGKHVKIAEKVSKKFGGIPVAVTNDANAAAIGEMLSQGVKIALPDIKCKSLDAGCYISSCDNTGRYYDDDKKSKPCIKDHEEDKGRNELQRRSEKIWNR